MIEKLAARAIGMKPNSPMPFLIARTRIFSLMGAGCGARMRHGVKIGIIDRIIKSYIVQFTFCKLDEDG